MTAEGKRLFDELQRGEMARGRLRIWWQGQISYALRGAAGTLLVDPFLTPMERRLVAPPFSPADISVLDAILVTHEHIDHFDRDFIRAALTRFPDLPVVMPLPLARQFAGEFPPGARLVGTKPGERIDCGAFAIHPIPARHGVTMRDAYTYGEELSDGMVRYLGYVVDLGGATVYAAGDTLVSDEQIDALRAQPLPVDVALLPINGRDYYREKAGMVGNMDPREAAMLAESIGADLVIPGHYDMFAANRGYPGHFVEIVNQSHPGLHAAVLSKTRVFNYAAPER